ncbi:hypothetical protein [Xenorhabdus bovienii]|nr:hypothetical protein [Xenorhabdus bovienii]
MALLASRSDFSPHHQSQLRFEPHSRSGRAHALELLSLSRR